MKIVFNTSPLIFLTRLELLETFLSQPGEYFTPQAVFDEIQAKEDEVSLSLKTIFANQKIEIKPIQMSVLANSLNQRLGRGESEAMTLALELNADYIILDDFAARREASRLGLKVKGTLAIIKKLQQEGQITIDKLEELYQRIVSIGFRVKRSVFDDIFT
jgi:predicted nucleic acid-binding protein